MDDHQKDSPAPLKQRSELSLVIRPSDAAKQTRRRASASAAKDHKHDRDHSDHKGHNDHKGKKDNKDLQHKHHKDHSDHKDDPKQHRHSEPREKPKDQLSSTEKCLIINEYSEIVQNIKQQNEHMENLKKQMKETTDPKQKKSLEMVYNAEEEKLNEEIIKAMVLQTKCPYEKWPPIPLTTTIHEDASACKAQDLLVQARRQTSEETKNESIYRAKPKL